MRACVLRVRERFARWKGAERVDERDEERRSGVADGEERGARRREEQQQQQRRQKKNGEGRVSFLDAESGFSRFP